MSASDAPPGALYDRVARASASRVIAGYSTSFGWASRLLDEPVRTDVRSIYALVRLADEIVDDPDPRLRPEDRARLLAELEQQTGAALSGERSTNLVVHAFALAAREHGIDAGLVDPFFRSMRADLTVTAHDAASLDTYIHGSAEVVGLMCLRVFVGGDESSFTRLRDPAVHLAAAFQKVNFLRDLAEDHSHLGRTYGPELDLDVFDDARRDAALDQIDADLRSAAQGIPQLPPSSRRAVAAAHGLYRELALRLRRTPSAQIRVRRVRVPGPVKARVLASALLGGGR